MYSVVSMLVDKLWFYVFSCTFHIFDNDFVGEIILPFILIERIFMVVMKIQ